MTSETNLETGLPYAKFDHGDTRIRQSQFTYAPDWRWEYVELLKRREYGRAEELEGASVAGVEGAGMVRVARERVER